jgi:hypothetical protein
MNKTYNGNVQDILLLIQDVDARKASTFEIVCKDGTTVSVTWDRTTSPATVTVSGDPELSNTIRDDVQRRSRDFPSWPSTNRDALKQDQEAVSLRIREAAIQETNRIFGKDTQLPR